MVRAAILTLGVWAVLGGWLWAEEGAGWRRDHPRIYIRPGDIPRLRERVRAPEFAPAYAELKAAVDRYTKPHQNPWSVIHQAEATTFVYLMENRDPAYLDKLRMYLDWMVAQKGSARDQLHWTAGQRVRALALALDWAYPDLSQAEKRRYMQSIIDHVEDVLFKYWRHSDYMNQTPIHQGHVIFAAAALLGEGYDDERAQKYLDYATNLMKDHLIPARNQVAGARGGWHESVGYLSFFFLDEALQMQAYSTLTGEDVFKLSTFFPRTYRWLIYARRNHDHAPVLSDDIRKRSGPGPQEPGFPRSLVAAASLVNSHYRDPYVQYVRNAADNEWDLQRWLYLTWYDPTIPALPDVTKEPLASLHDGIGWVIMRSGWGPADTFAVFQSGDWYEGHQHHDENSFVIHKGGSLAIDSGDYVGPETKQSHKVAYNRRTIAHNTILVYDPNEDTAGLPNDGGQLFPNVLNDDGRRFFSQAEGTPFDTGDIVAYETNDTYTYASGDASRAYSAEKMRSFTRQFLYLRPDLFVVFDRVSATRAEFPKTWLLHSIEEPALEGNRFTIRHGPGRLFGYTLLPRQARIEKVGGPGREFLVAGKNYPVEAGPEAGAWRIEVKPPSANETDLFLHVLYAAVGDAAPPQRVQLLTEGIRPGQVAAAIEVGDKRFIATFETQGPPRGKVLIEDARSGRALFSKELTTARLSSPKSEVSQ